MRREERPGGSDEAPRPGDGRSSGDAENGRTHHAIGSGGEPINPGVARNLSEIARDFQAETTSAAVMHRIVTAAVDEISGACGAAITLLDHGTITSPAHSDERSQAVGLAQEDVSEGPCVDTSRQEVTLRSDDLRNDSRWPRWGAVAVAHGVQSVLSLQLFVEEHSMGALNVYGDATNAFDEEAENTALLLAAHAAIALAGTRNVENLSLALNSRDVIGQAKGILMERYKIDPDQAFQLLVMSSQATHHKLREVAARLAETGELDIPRPRS
jgi:GAF domain-containing protein